MATGAYTARLADRPLADLVSMLPAVMVTGPRAAGKTTTARRVAASVLRLDDPQAAAAVAFDPDAALRRLTEPVLVDEWQEVPEILGAVKRAVDDDPRPGRFVLTGSVEADVTGRTWPGTGRVVRLVLHGLTQREILGRTGSAGLLARVRDGSLDLPGQLVDAPDLFGYLDLALASGFPEPALRLTGQYRRTWLEAYLDHVVSRDVAAAGQTRDPTRLRRYVETLGLSTAGTPTDATLLQAADVAARTAKAYDAVLQSLYVVERVPAWATNRLSRLVKRSKVYVTDAGLAMAAARVPAEALVRDADLIGRVLDTFVASQLRPELALLDPPGRLHHVRSADARHEIDLVVDLGQGRLLGIEVKATAAPTRRDARHLSWLRDALGEEFVAGWVLHTGRYCFELDERVWALPIASLWSG